MTIRLGLTSKMTLIFIVFAAVLLAGLGLLVYAGGRVTLEEAIVSELAAVAIEKEEALIAWAEQQRSGIATLAASPGLLEHIEDFVSAAAGSNQAAYQQTTNELRIFTGASKLYLALLVLEPGTGRVLLATDASEEGKFREHMPYFMEGQTAPYLTTAYYDVTLQTPAMTASAPLKSPEGRLIGVLAGRLNLEGMNNIITRTTGLHKTFEAFVINQTGLLVTQPRFIPEPAVLRRSLRTETTQRCLLPGSGTIMTNDYRGVPVISVFRWMPELQFCVEVKVEQAEAFEPLATFGLTVLIMGVLAMGGASLIAVGLARTVTRPILAIQREVVRFGESVTDLRLPETSRDELGTLARAFNTMAANLVEKERQLVSYAEQLELKVEARTAALSANERLLQTVLENLPVGVWILDKTGQIARANPTAQRIWSSAETVEKDHFPDYKGWWPATGKPIAVDEWPSTRALTHRETILDEEVEIESLDGKRKRILISAIPLYDMQQDLIGIVIVNQDITAQKRAEENVRALNAELEQRVVERTARLEAINKELETFSYSVSHDLRAPLRAMDGFCRALLEDYAERLDEQGKHYLDRVVAGSKRMGQLIDALLQFSRLTRSELLHEPLDLSALARDIMGELQQAQPDRRVEFTIAERLSAKGDIRLIRIVLQNLLSNAWKFTSKRPTACIKVGVTAFNGSLAYFVSDNGAGFDMAYVGKLFGAFQRLHAMNEFEGNGIGLATVQRIIHRHGGRVWAEGAVNEGATFYFTLPA